MRRQVFCCDDCVYYIPLDDAAGRCHFWSSPANPNQPPCEIAEGEEEEG